MCILENEIALQVQIILRNEFLEIMTCSKIQVPKLKYGYQINKKVVFRKLMKLAPTLTSSFRYIINLAHKKPKHIHNPWHNQKPGLFKSSTLFRSLSDILQRLWKIVPGYNYFCNMLLLRLFWMFVRILNTPIYLQMLLTINMLTHIQNFVYPWHIQNPVIFLSQNLFRLQGIFIILY